MGERKNSHSKYVAMWPHTHTHTHTGTKLSHLIETSALVAPSVTSACYTRPVCLSGVKFDEAVHL